MTGEPTAPVPIPDLLAAIDRLDAGGGAIGEYGVYQEMSRDDRDLIVRGVRDMAARVETLEQALEFYAQQTRFRHRIIDADDGRRARAALSGQSTTEQPDPYRDWRFGVSFVEDDVIVHASAPGDTEWRTMLTVSRPASQSTTEQP